MWLRLTKTNGLAVLINAVHFQAILPNEDGKTTSIEFGQLCYEVEESIDEIAAAISDPQHALRVVKTGWSNETRN